MEKESYLSSGQHEGFYPPTENPPAYMPSAPRVEQAFMQTSAPPGQQIVHVVSSPIPSFGPRPANTICPFCHKDIRTRVKRRYTGSTHVTAFLLGCMTCCLCCWIPYVTDFSNDYEHECPDCNRFLGIFSRYRGRR